MKVVTRTHVLLVIIALLLATVAQLLGTGTASAAPAKPVQYKVVDIGQASDSGRLEQQLNAFGAAGWQLDAVVPSNGGSQSMLVFRKAP
jgi:hypothetical protein